MAENKLADKEIMNYLNQHENKDLLIMAIWSHTEYKLEKITLGDIIDLINRQQAENERLQGEIKEKTRMVFEKVINKFISIKDLYVIVNGETVPWEPIDEVEYLFGMTLSGENEEIEKETDRVIKELLEDE